MTQQPLTDQQLDDIEQRATSEHLTPGPWDLAYEACDCGGDYPCGHGPYVTGVITPVPTSIAADRCKRTGEEPRDYDFHRGEIGDFTESDWALMVAAREDVPALLAEIRRQRAVLPEPEPEAIHTHFGLTYANYLVLPRTLLQSMDDAWQTQFVALLDQLHEAFAHVPQAECYEVTAGTEHIVGEMGDAQLKQAGITVDWYRGETPPEGLDAQDLAEWQEQHEDPEGPAYSRNGEELDSHSRVLIPCADPVPHYNRGRTRIEPATP